MEVFRKHEWLDHDGHGQPVKYEQYEPLTVRWFCASIPDQPSGWHTLTLTEAARYGIYEPCTHEKPCYHGYCHWAIVT